MIIGWLVNKSNLLLLHNLVEGIIHISMKSTDDEMPVQVGDSLVELETNQQSFIACQHHETVWASKDDKARKDYLCRILGRRVSSILQYPYLACHHW
jgi:hypothetical protein